MTLLTNEARRQAERHREVASISCETLTTGLINPPSDIHTPGTVIGPVAQPSLGQLACEAAQAQVREQSRELFQSASRVWPFAEQGAALFQLWTGQTHRATRDLDLLGQDEPSADRLRQLFRDICSLRVNHDGLTFLTDATQAEQIKEDDEYQAIRLRIEARLGNIRLPLQIDIGFGDAVMPGPQAVTYPTLLDFPAPRLNAYPRETAVAEKFQAMVQLGMPPTLALVSNEPWNLAWVPVEWW